MNPHTRMMFLTGLGIILMAWGTGVTWHLVLGAALIGLAAAWRDDPGGAR